MTAAEQIIDIETPSGLGRAHVYPAADARAVLVLGHGAGGGVSAPDLQLAATVGNEHGVTVALIEQPYRVAGRKAPAPPAQADAAFTALCNALRHTGSPLLVGGRSYGSRVACRTADELGAAGVLCLAFPVHPPGRPEQSRQPELSGVQVPTLVIQGASDPFGMPAGAPNIEIVTVAGDHGLKKEHATIRAAIGEWLNRILA